MSPSAAGGEDGAGSSAAGGAAPVLSVVVPAWNSAAVLASHLPSMLKEARSLAGGAEIVIVDDGSDPAEPLAELAAAAGPIVRLLRLDTNRGFAAACNAGAAAAAGDLLLFLNTDMHVERGCLATLVAALAPRPDLFGVTPVVDNLEERFPESTTALRFHRGVFDVVQPGRSGAGPPAAGELREVAFPCGGALLCRRRAFLDLGGFSELFAPFYWEDVDLGWRARRAGLANAECGAARVLHDHARTIGRLPRGAVRRTYERNRLLFTWVHLAGAGPWAAHLAWLLPRWVAAIVRLDPAIAALPTALRRIPDVARLRTRLRSTGGVAATLHAACRAAGSLGWPPCPAPERLRG